jgi:hypothetical protein
MVYGGPERARSISPLSSVPTSPNRRPSLRTCHQSMNVEAITYTIMNTHTPYSGPEGGSGMRLRYVQHTWRKYRAAEPTQARSTLTSSSLISVYVLTVSVYSASRPLECIARKVSLHRKSPENAVLLPCSHIPSPGGVKPSMSRVQVRTAGCTCRQ